MEGIGREIRESVKEASRISVYTLLLLMAFLTSCEHDEIEEEGWYMDANDITIEIDPAVEGANYLKELEENTRNLRKDLLRQVSSNIIIVDTRVKLWGGDRLIDTLEKMIIQCENTLLVLNLGIGNNYSSIEEYDKYLELYNEVESAKNRYVEILHRELNFKTSDLIGELDSMRVCSGEISEISGEIIWNLRSAHHICDKLKIVNDEENIKNDCAYRRAIVLAELGEFSKAGVVVQGIGDLKLAYNYYEKAFYNGDISWKRMAKHGVYMGDPYALFKTFLNSEEPERAYEIYDELNKYGGDPFLLAPSRREEGGEIIYIGLDRK